MLYCYTGRDQRSDLFNNTAITPVKPVATNGQTCLTYPVIFFGKVFTKACRIKYHCQIMLGLIIKIIRLTGLTVGRDRLNEQFYQIDVVVYISV